MRKILGLNIIVTLLFLFVNSSLAETPGQSFLNDPNLQKAMIEADRDNAKKNQDVIAEIQCLDVDMDSVLKKLNSQFDKIGKNKLKDSQQAWIKYRETDAKLKADSYRGGLMQANVYYSTILERTKTRLDELRGMLE